MGNRTYATSRTSQNGPFSNRQSFLPVPGEGSPTGWESWMCWVERLPFGEHLWQGRPVYIDYATVTCGLRK